MARSAGTVGVAAYGAPTYNMPPAHSFNQSMTQAMPQAPPVLAPYAPPPSLTAGLPDPVSVERQKSGYMRTLEDQEKQNQTALDSQRKQRLEYIYSQAEQMKKQLLMQVDQQVKQQEMTLTQQYNEQLLQLNQQYHTQKAALEHQALQLTMHYQQKVMEDEMKKKQIELQKEQYEAQHKFQIDMQKLQSEAQGTAPPGVHMGLGAVMPGANGSYVPPPMSAPGSVHSYSPPPVLNAATAPYGSAGSVSLTSAGSFQLPAGGTGVMQPQVAGYGSGGYIPARTVLPAAGSFSARPDYLANSGYVSAPVVTSSQPAGIPAQHAASFSAREPIASSGYAVPSATYA